MCDPSVFLDFNCIVFEDTHGSDHCPIQLVYNLSDVLDNDQIPRWNLKKADWSLFKQHCITNITSERFEECSDEMMINNYDKMSVFTDLLLDCAMVAIPMTKINPKKKPKPYFDEECKEMISERKKAFNRIRNNSSLENIKKYQVLRAKCQKTIKQNKRSSWKQYVSSVNEPTPTKMV